ncbi:MAG: hypothetical protein JKY43_04240 [Phycisphaerales bacterium]|nr:hypothetical protein [Phycisphaerales bacterium]
MSDTPNTPDETPTPESVAEPEGAGPETTGLEATDSEATGSEATEPKVEPTPEHVFQDCAKAPLNRKWSIKLFIITFFVIGFGGLGLYDAVVKYPARGERFADWAKWQYLDAAKNAGTEDFGVFERNSSVPDPVAEYTKLSDPEIMRRNASDAQNQASTRQLRATMYNTRYQWLNGLKIVGQLTPEHTIIENPSEALAQSRALWTSASSIPKPLKSYDIPSQWLIMILCWGIGFWMLVNIIKVIGQKFSWDAKSMTLTVPGPIEITPENIDEVDKRKWDKFIVFIKLNATHSSHGGKEIKVDTYQHALVEDWILAMEAKALGSQEDGE